MERSLITLNFFRMINIVIAENAIPIESKNITNPNILSKVFAKNKIIIAKAAKPINSLQVHFCIRFVLK